MKVNCLYKRKWSLIGIVLCLLLAACGGQSATDTAVPTSEPAFVTTPDPNGEPAQFAPVDDDSYPAPDVSAEVTSSDSYPAPTEVQVGSDGREGSALESLRLAHALALAEFHPETYPSAILPSQKMLVTMGNPPTKPGWIFRFRKPDSNREFIVQVVDGIVTGSTLMEAVAQFGDVELPINADSVQIDSAQFIEMYEAAAKERGTWREGAPIDYGLVNLEGGSGHVWFAIDPITDVIDYSIDAITGEAVANPYQ